MYKFIFLFFILSFANITLATNNVFDIFEEEESEIKSKKSVEEDAELEDTIEEVEEKEDDSKILEKNYYNTAVIRILNKVTARTTILKISTNKSKDIDGLSILMHFCYQTDKDLLDSRALIEVKSDKEKLFHGWIFANEPGLNIFEHPIYNINLVTCKNL